jgi:hypothetical protein
MPVAESHEEQCCFGTNNHQDVVEHQQEAIVNIVKGEAIKSFFAG